MPRTKGNPKVGRSTTVAWPEELAPFRSWAMGEALARVLADFDRAPLTDFPEHMRRLLVTRALMDDVTSEEITALRRWRIPDGRKLSTQAIAEATISGLETLKKPGDEPRPTPKAFPPRDLGDEFYRCLRNVTPRAGLARGDVASLLSVAGAGLKNGLAPGDWADLVARVGVPLARLEAVVFASGTAQPPLPLGLVEAEVRRELADAALRSALTFLEGLRGVKEPAIASVGEWSLRLTKGPWMFFGLPAADVAAANAEAEYRELLRRTGADPMDPGTVRILEAFCALLLGSAGTLRPHERPVASHESRTAGLGLNAERDKITFDGKDIFYLEGTNPKPKWIGPNSDVGKLLLSLKVLGRVSEQVERSDSRGRLNRVTAFPGCVTGRAKNLRLTGILAGTPISDDLRALAPTR